MSTDKFNVIPMSAEIGTADQLFEEIRDLVLQDKYENMTISNLIAAAEREACAELCEGHYDTAQAARAIRARGEE